MRIIHLSDVHLSECNIESFKLYYRDKLIYDLRILNNEKKIDVILITGDLVDKGGDSLGGDCYLVFEEEVLKPISSALDIPSNRIMFVPGNHDIQREKIEQNSEYYMESKMTCDIANDYLKDNLKNFRAESNRIEKYKSFERKFHKDDNNYIYSNNESIAFIDIDSLKVGFILINDSWRCSQSLTKEKHFFGFNQLLKGINRLKEYKSRINIAVFHHPIEVFNVQEIENVENILKSQDINIAFFGHNHKYSFSSIHSDTGGYVSIQGRSAFNNPNESDSKFQPGYSIVDLNLNEMQYTINARKFIKLGGYRFDRDTDALKDGLYTGSLLLDRNLVKLFRGSTAPQAELPDGYTADVNQIVRLLIGKSLYSQPYICVRELIQNSVDACSRIAYQGSELPQITMRINTKDNYFEVIDQGDGMTRKVLKEQFSVIGKSISQEYNEATGYINLISQFGIGFISTFIIAKKVIVSTKSQGETQIDFEVSDVFKGFNYTHIGDKIDSHGTSIRVYLKEKYKSHNIFTHAKSYCRHVSNVNFSIDGARISYKMDWNTENGAGLWETNNTRYEAKLTISINSRPIIASNCGFFVGYNIPSITPLYFPSIIGGEINFAAKGIDLDMARTNIIESDKSVEVKNELSTGLRNLFRIVLESKDENLIKLVTYYLQFYYQNFEALQHQFVTSYLDFYSKKELLELCLRHCRFHYAGRNISLGEIVDTLRSKGINIIYFTTKSNKADYQTLVEQSLIGSANFILRAINHPLSFHLGQSSQLSLQTFFQLVANELRFELKNVDSVNLKDVANIYSDVDALPTHFVNQINKIQSKISGKILIGEFNNDSIPALRLKTEYYLNVKHPGLTKMITEADSLSEEVIEAYLCGIMNIELIDFIKVPEVNSQIRHLD